MIELEKILNEAKTCREHPKCWDCPLADGDENCTADSSAYCIGEDDHTFEALEAVNRLYDAMADDLKAARAREIELLDKLREVETERTKLQIKIEDMESAAAEREDEACDHADDLPCCEVVDRQDDILLELLRRVRLPETQCTYSETSSSHCRTWSLSVSTSDPETID